MANWSLLTNHARLLLAIENEPGLRVRDMAARLDMTEKGVMLILRDLRESGYVTRRRDDHDARRSYYTVVPTKPFRKDAMSHHAVGELLQLLAAHEPLDAVRAADEPQEARPAAEAE